MKRRDFEVRNQRGLKLVCTQWRPAFTEDTSKLPCVVYLHGNSSARVDVVKTRSLAVSAPERGLLPSKTLLLSRGVVVLEVWY